MGQIIKPVCVCQYVRVRLCALARSHFLIDFHQSIIDEITILPVLPVLACYAFHAPATVLVGFILLIVFLF